MFCCWLLSSFCFTNEYISSAVELHHLPFQRGPDMSVCVFVQLNSSIIFAFLLVHKQIKSFFFFAPGCVCEIINSITKQHGMVKIGDLVIVQLAISFKGHALGNLTYRLPQTQFCIIFSSPPSRCLSLSLTVHPWIALAIQ